jgi:hypothetical protein
MLNNYLMRSILMLKSILITGAVALTLFVSGPRAAEATVSAANNLEPAINGQVSASGLFPTPEIEEQFSAYLVWTKAQGLRSGAITR